MLAANLGNPQSFNQYAYVENNPTNLFDATGLLPQCGDANPCSTPSSGGLGCGDFVDGSEIDCGGSNNDEEFIIEVRVKLQLTFRPIPVKQACKNVPQHPPGESATANLNLIDDSIKGMFPGTQAAFFIDVFETGGAFDYKTNYSGSGWGPQRGQQFIDYGNWNFGYSCGAHYGSYLCKGFAGAAHMLRAARQGKNPFCDGLPFLIPPYGDQARDNQQVQNGATAQKSGCVQ